MFYSIVSVAVWLNDPAVAVIVTVCAAAATDVVIVNVVDVLPCGTVTVNGTAADTLLLFSATTNPPNPAALDSVIVALALPPGSTSVGEIVRLCSAPGVCGFTVNVAVADPTVPSVTVMVTVCAAVTENVVMVKPAENWPAGI